MKKTLAEAYADYTHIPFIELDPKNIPKDVFNKINRTHCKTVQCHPF